MEATREAGTTVRRPTWLVLLLCVVLALSACEGKKESRSGSTSNELEGATDSDDIQLDQLAQYVRPLTTDDPELWIHGFLHNIQLFD